MGKKTSIYLSESALEVIGEKPDSLSGRINDIICRYGEAIQQGMPEFSLNEWCAIVDANNGTFIDGIPFNQVLIWANVIESSLDGLGEKWRIDPIELSETIRKLPLISQMAIAEVVTKFWSSPRLNKLETRDLLIESGARVKD